jgi:sec-independent protein translocase protein TatC
MKGKNKDEMSFLDHLNDLRWVLVRCSVAILIMAIVAYMFSDFIFDTIIFGPTQPDFFTYRFFCDASHYLGFADSICIEELPFTIQNTQMEGQVNIFVWTCILVGFILAFPYILYQFWTFISPALYEKERKNAIWFIIVSSLLFFIGIYLGIL